VPVAARITPILKRCQSSTIPEALPQTLSHNLVNWFLQERHHIPVPGRGEKDPYAIWIAEVMMQQTQVTTVWPYYKKWINRFPDVASLARTDLDVVLKLWEGLGYYSRARNLHKGANYVAEHFDGQLPRTSAELLSIPGIGPYTAAAIASFAYAEVIPLLDGNVIRVMSRVGRIQADIAKAGTKKMIMEALTQLIPPENPGAFNQGLMDLGRVICLPQNPRCETCPIASFCQAFKQGDMDRFPVKAQKQELPHYRIVIGLIKRDGDLLIQKRKEDGLLGGLWEFPGGKVEAGESLEDAVLREIKEETGLDVLLEQEIDTIKHAYTHFKITLTAFYCRWNGGEAQVHAATENRWVSPETLSTYAFPKANLKIIDHLKP
jgi:A/G-specific adenine glycosylase